MAALSYIYTNESLLSLAPHIRVSSTKWPLPHSHYAVFQSDPLLLWQRCWLGQTWPCPHAFAPFHTWGSKYGYFDDPFHIIRDFIATHGPPYPFIHFLSDIRKINVPISSMIIWENYSPPLPNVACPQATTRIELKTSSQGMEFMK